MNQGVRRIGFVSLVNVHAIGERGVRGHGFRGHSVLLHGADVAGVCLAGPACRMDSCIQYYSGMDDYRMARCPFVGFVGSRLGAGYSGYRHGQKNPGPAGVSVQ